MPRPATGQVLYDTRRAEPVYALRFRAYGKRQYLTLGSKQEGWTQKKAEQELQNVLADVRRGIWQPPTPAPTPATDSDPTFHEFASQWYEANADGWSQKTRDDYKWRLSHHLLPFFKEHRLSRITVVEVDRYRAAKVREAARLAKAQEVWQARIAAEQDEPKRKELRKQRPPRPLAPPSLNKTIITLAQILEVAVEYEIIARNPAKGRRLRLKASKPAPVWLDRAQQIEALLNAAGELDREAGPVGRHIERKALLATLVFAGLRVGELCELRWRDVDLNARRIAVKASKTDAGRRAVDVFPVLRDTLTDLKTRRRPSLDAYVFAAASGAASLPANVRKRIVAPAVERANQRLAESGENPLPEPLTPHKLRHTYASLLVALGADPGAAMDQLGHTDARFTLSVYRHGMRRDQASKCALRKLVGLDDSGV